MVGKGILWGLGFALALATACTRKNPNELWIYTSLYKDTIAELEPLLQKHLPGVKIQWFQSGSESVAARVSAEITGNGVKADLVLLSDPEWYAELKDHGHLLKYSSAAAAKISSELRDSEDYFTAVRLLPVVMAHYPGPGQLPPPEKWSDLLDPKWKNRVTMGSPTESGAAQAVVSQLSRLKGWEYFEKLHAGGLLAAGSSASVIFRIETKERAIGILLLENILQSRMRNSPIEPIYPKDGGVLLVSSMAILKKAPHPELAKRAYDAFLGEEIQQRLVSTGQYSPIYLTAQPPGGPPLKDWLKSMPKPPHYGERQIAREKFTSIVMRP